MLDFMQNYSGALTFIATVILVGITAFYAYWTKGILEVTTQQSRLSLSPVLGIKIKNITISEIFGPRRRQMSVEVELVNVGNAPAIEVLVDSEIELRYSRIKNKSIIPARHEPDMRPFLKPDETVFLTPNFGNKLVSHFFDDVRESNRLNLHRIETDPTKEAHKTSRIKLFAYYRNSHGQYFRSHYEAEICIWTQLGHDPIPQDTETADVSVVYIPRPTFHAGVFDKKLMNSEISERNAQRALCGW